MSSSSLALLPWSYSKLTQHEKCPYSIELLCGKDKPTFQKEKTTEQQKGIDIHKNIENFLKHDVPIPKPIPQIFESQLNKLRTQNAKSEFKISIGENWTPTKNWGVAILDILLVTPELITIVDIKDGKYHLSHVDQQICYALFVKVYNPNPLIKNQIWYLSESKIREYNFDLSTLNNYKARLQTRIDSFLNDEFRPPKPSKWNCLYCSAKSICDYNAS